MPTDISNAVGTARQFTPQPDNIYQGHYQGIGVSNGAPSATNSVLSTAESLSRLTEALQGYAVSHEKYMDVTGHQQAEAMINGMAPADIQKLNTIDAAQLYGYADSTDNPYFKAYADKLRGGFLASKMKQEYDAQYEMYPARSLDEEQQRYSEFTSKWKNDNLTGTNAPLNQYAFDMGYNESHLVNVAQLANQWVKKKNDNDVLVTMSQAQGDLGKILENSPQLLKTNGAMTAAVQTVFNNIRLMGLPANYREKLLKDFASEAIQSGHLDAERFEQMMNNVTVMSNLDGSTVNAASMLDMQTMRTAAADYNKQFMTQQKLDTINQYVKSKDLQGYLQKLTQMRQDDPDGAREFASLYAPISSGIATAQREEAARQRVLLQEQLKAQAKAAEQAQKQQTANGVLQAWMGGGNMYNGKPIQAYDIKSDVLYPQFLQKFAECVGNQDMDSMSRLMALPQAKDFKNSISADLVSQLDNLKPSDDGSVATSDKMASLLQFVATNPDSCEHLLGKEVSSRAKMLKSFVDMEGGDFESGLKDFAAYNTVDSDTKESFKGQVSSRMGSTGYTADNVPVLGGGTTSIPVYANPEMEDAAVNLASALACQSLPVDTALNQVGSIISNSYYAYKYAYIPKGVLNDIGTNDDEGFFKQSLDFYTGDADNVRYDRATQIFYYSDDDGRHNVSLGAIRSKARELAEATYNNPSTNNTDMSADDANAQRQDAEDAYVQDKIEQGGID